MNNLLLPIKPHPSKKISDEIKNKKDYINLTIGMPDYGPPKKILEWLDQHVKEAINKGYADFNKYADSRGVIELRQAISIRYDIKYNVQINHNQQIIVTNGAAEAIWLTIFTCTNIGDEVIIPDPCYMLYEPIISSLGRKVVRIKTLEETKFDVNLKLLEKCISHKTKLIIINSPSNPTGTIYTEQNLYDICDLANRKNIYVMHDEVFDDIIFDGIHYPIIAFQKKYKNLIMVNSFSKRYGMTGWRLGWLLGSDEFIEQALKAHTFMTLATNALIQNVVAHAVNNQEIEEIVKKNKDNIQKKSSLFCSLLNKIKGIELNFKPAGAMYVFPKINLLYKLLPKKYQFNSISESVGKFILDEAKVATIPGSAFGPSGDNYLRISIAGDEDDLEEAILRIKRLF